MNSETSSQTLTEHDESSKPSHFKIVFSHALVSPAVLKHKYHGAGTESDPYVVDFLRENDPRDPMAFSQTKKWIITNMVAFATLAVAFVSSAYSGGINQILLEFHTSPEIATLGISLFVLGFAIGPLLWAPLSELYGRQVLFFGTYAMLTAFSAAAAGSQNIQSLIILRFFAGAFGSSPLTNAGGVIADMFPASQRGLAMAVFSAAPFLGPTIGPIVGGFVGETVGWRWVEGVMAILSGVLWLLGALIIPETYAPVILRKRAAELSSRTGKVYISKFEAKGKKTTAGAAFKTALSRPWVLLLKEPIVLLLSIYMAVSVNVASVFEIY
jgi:multidrug resistance protein